MEKHKANLGHSSKIPTEIIWPWNFSASNVKKMFWTVNRIGHKAASTRTKYKILSDQKGFPQRIQKHKVDLGHKAFDGYRKSFLRFATERLLIHTESTLF